MGRVIILWQIHVHLHVAGLDSVTVTVKSNEVVLQHRLHCACLSTIDWLAYSQESAAQL